MEEGKKWFWILLDVLIVVAIINVVFFVMPAISNLGESFSPAHTITVTAEGKTTAAPDLAEINFSVVTQGANPQTLSDNNNNKMNSVMQFVESEGIASSDIKTTNYNLQPNYQWNKDRQVNEIDGYTLTQTVQVKVHDLNKVASVLGGLSPLGVNQIGGVDFTFADDNAVLAAARADAFNKASEKAQEMANEAGVKLGRVVSVTENNYIPQPMPVFAASAAMGMGTSVSLPPVQPGTQDITDTVSIIYAVN